MKSLVEFIKEARAASEEEKLPSSKKVSFNFTDFEGAEDLLKSAQEIADKDGVEIEIEDSKISFSLPKDDSEKYDGLLELLQDYIQERGKDQKRASDESYAQKVAKCEKTIADAYEYLDDAKAEADDSSKEEDKKEDEDDKKGEDKKEDEKPEDKKEEE